MGQDQRISIAEAIIAYTRTAQYITGMPNVGQLKPGYHADFIVLDQDILSVAPMELDHVQVVETYIDGERVYKR